MDLSSGINALHFLKITHIKPPLLRHQPRQKVHFNRHTLSPIDRILVQFQHFPLSFAMLFFLNHFIVNIIGFFRYSFLRTSHSNPCVETQYNLMHNAISDHCYFRNKKKNYILALRSLCLYLQALSSHGYK